MFIRWCYTLRLHLMFITREHQFRAVSYVGDSCSIDFSYFSIRAQRNSDRTELRATSEEDSSSIALRSIVNYILTSLCYRYAFSFVCYIGNHNQWRTGPPGNREISRWAPASWSLSRSRFAGFDARRAPAGLAAGGRSRRQRAIAGRPVVSHVRVVDCDSTCGYLLMWRSSEGRWNFLIVKWRCCRLIRRLISCERRSVMLMAA